MPGNWSQHEGLTPENVEALRIYEVATSFEKLRKVGIQRHTVGTYYTGSYDNGKTTKTYVFKSECAAVVLHPKYSEEWLRVEIKANGEISAAEKDIEPDMCLPIGHWTKHEGLTPENVEALRIYEECIKQDDKVGVQHSTTGVYFKQFVNGINYAFANQTIPLVLDALSQHNWVYTHKSFDDLEKIEPPIFKDHPPIEISNVA